MMRHSYGASDRWRILFFSRAVIARRRATCGILVTSGCQEACAMALRALCLRWTGRCVMTLCMKRTAVVAAIIAVALLANVHVIASC
jgi:hypothetical protein